MFGKYLSTVEAAKIAKCNRTSIRDAIIKGNLAAVKRKGGRGSFSNGFTYRILHSSLMKWLGKDVKTKKPRQKGLFEKPKPKEPDWKNAGIATFKITGRETHPRAAIRFTCGQCKQVFIGLVNHRDRVPIQCNVCKPQLPGEMEFKSSGDWIKYPTAEAGLAVAE